MQINLFNDIWFLGTYKIVYEVLHLNQLYTWNQVTQHVIRNPNNNYIFVYDFYFHYLRQTQGNNIINHENLNYQPRMLRNYYEENFNIFGFTFNRLAHNSYPRIFINPQNYVNRIENPNLEMPDSCANNHQNRLEYRTGRNGLYLGCLECNWQSSLYNFLR